MKLTVKELAEIVQGQIEGAEDVVVSSFSPIESAVEGSLSFLAKPGYESYLYETPAAVVLVKEDFIPQQKVNATLLRVADVYSALSILLDKMQSHNKAEKKGIEPNSHIARTAHIAEDAWIGAFAYIDEGVEIGTGAQIFPHVYIGTNCRIGKGTVIHSGAKVYHNCVIGDDCIIHSGAIIGSDGFGFAPQPDGTFRKIPQTGNVVIGNNVEIGANTTIDRATLSSTAISDGVKLDNLIQVAHNVQIGDNTVIASQAGISGSTKIGCNVMIGGQVGIVGHITVADGSQIGAQSGVAKSITEAGQKWFGSPALSHREALRVALSLPKLPDLEKRIKQLEKVFTQTSNEGLKGL